MIPIIIFLVALLAVTLGVAMYATYAERKVAAFMQDRIGPDRAGASPRRRSTSASTS